MDDVFFKKIKFFFFKTHSISKNNNNLINFLFFKKFNEINFNLNFFKNNPLQTKHDNYSLYTYKSFFFFLKNSSFKKKELPVKIKLNVYKSLSKNFTPFSFFQDLSIKQGKKNFLKVQRRRLAKSRKNSIFKNNFFLNKSNSLLFFKKNTKNCFLNFFKNDDLVNYSLNDFFFKNFFFKQFFLFKNNNFTDFSDNYFNSYFYNSFFENSLNPSMKLNLTNFTPYNLIDVGLSNKIFKKLDVNYVPSFYRYIYYGLANSIEQILKKKFFLKIFSKNSKSDLILDCIDSIFIKNRSVQTRIGRGFFLHEMLDIIYTTFFQKDLNFLIKWFIKTMDRISFLNHKKFISSFKQIIINNSDFFIKNNNIGGFFFDIRGKVGVTGDSKKRHFSFYVGDFSKTSKKYKFDYQFDVVRTYTGALGITMYLSYK